MKTLCFFASFLCVTINQSPGQLFAETVTRIRVTGSGEIRTNPPPFINTHLGIDAPFTFDLIVDLAPDVAISSSPTIANYNRRVTGSLNFGDETLLDLEDGIMSVGNHPDIDLLTFHWVPNAVEVPGSAFGGTVTMTTSRDTIQTPEVTFQWNNPNDFYDSTSSFLLHDVINAASDGSGDPGLISVNFGANDLRVLGNIFADSIVVATAVPEPNSLILGGVVGVMGFLKRRRLHLFSAG